MHNRHICLAVLVVDSAKKTPKSLRIKILFARYKSILMIFLLCNSRLVNIMLSYLPSTLNDSIERCFLSLNSTSLVACWVIRGLEIKCENKIAFFSLLATSVSYRVQGRRNRVATYFSLRTTELRCVELTSRQKPFRFNFKSRWNKDGRLESFKWKNFWSSEFSMRRCHVTFHRPKTK